jgi:type IV pilus assembly protein PilM
MTAWNRLTSFTRPRSTGSVAGPSSAFDPSHLGDPHVPGSDRPALGFADARAGSAGGSAERRHPIGFAPPEEQPRYCTEISFKRHHSLAAASSGPSGPADSEPEASPWRTPASEPEGGTVEIGHDWPHLSEDAVETAITAARPEQPVVAASEPEADENIPFYRRELSFRRKHQDVIEEPVGDTSGEDIAVDIADDAPAEIADDYAPPVVDEQVDEQVVAVTVPAEVVPDEHEPDTHAPAGHVSVAAPLLMDEGWPEAVEVVAAVEAVEDVATVAAVEAVAAVAAVEVDEAAAAEAAPFAVEPTPAGGPVLEAGDTPVTEELPEAPAAEDTVEVVLADEARTRTKRRKRGENATSAPKRTSTRSGKGRRVVGLKIGASQIAAAVVIETGDGHELVKLARRPLESGIVVDGEVRDADALVTAVKEFFEEHRLPKKDVRIGLASNRIGVRTFDIDGIDDEARFDNAVRFKAHEVLPVAVDESVLDYRVIEERLNEAGEPSRRVLLVVAPRDQVAPYAEVARRAGLKLAGIDLEALALLRAFIGPRAVAGGVADDTAKVVVAIGHESSTLLVAGGGVCEFTRVFDWGGGSLLEGIADALEVHPAEAVTILRHLSLSGSGRQLDSLDEAARARALAAVRLRLTPFARSLVSSLQFYQTQPDSLGIGEILITGGTSHLEGLDSVLHEMIGVTVRLGDPLDRVVVRDALDPDVERWIGSMAVPIGLAIDDLLFRGVNLFPRDATQKPRRGLSLVAIGAPAAVAIPVAALAVLFMQSHGAVQARQGQLEAVEAQIAALPEPQGPQIDAGVVGDQAQRATAVAYVLGGRVVWESVFGDLSRILPENVWLESVTAIVPNESAVPGQPVAVAAAPTSLTPGASGVTIHGFTYTQPDVALLLTRLQTVPSLTNVTLRSSAEAQRPDGKTVIDFRIQADLNTTGGPR